ncbi:MAG: hypothetical protein HZA81_00585 [Candidatus Taylorbacteria bacterium]|nr:hypothetical protein [Candidatus Taylorbacteria bacterium]
MNNVTYPGYVLLSDGGKLTFKAASHKMAVAAAQKVLNLRTMTMKAFRKAKAIAIYFGIQARQIFPFRQQRSKDAHADRMRNRQRLPVIDHKDGIDVGRRRHYVAPQRFTAMLAAA